jgi:hypothetical protein
MGETVFLSLIVRFTTGNRRIWLSRELYKKGFNFLCKCLQESSIARDIKQTGF